MTTQDLTTMALPYVRHAVAQARPTVIDGIGRAAWIALWPAWAVVTGPLLPLLVRVGIELAIGLTAPQALPLLDVLNRLAGLLSSAYLTEADRAFLADLTALLSTPRGAMLEPVRATLDLPAGAVEAGCD